MAETGSIDAAAVGHRAWWRRGRRPRWRSIVSLCLGFVLLVIVYLLASLWFVHRTGNSDQARPVDAIVVLGAAQYDGRPSPQLAARLDHVVDLWRRGLAEVVVTTGGNRPGDRYTEAQASAEYLVARGVPPDAVLEVGGDTSYASLRAARDAVVAIGLHTVLLVSDPYHSLRIRLVAQELGLTAYVSPTHTSPVQGSQELRREVKEAFGVGLGRIIGFDRLLSITG